MMRLLTVLLARYVDGQWHRREYARFQITIWGLYQHIIYHECTFRKTGYIEHALPREVHRRSTYVVAPACCQKRKSRSHSPYIDNFRYHRSHIPHNHSSCTDLEYYLLWWWQYSVSPQQEGALCAYIKRLFSFSECAPQRKSHTDSKFRGPEGSLEYTWYGISDLLRRTGVLSTVGRDSNG